MVFSPALTNPVNTALSLQEHQKDSEHREGSAQRNGNILTDSSASDGCQAAVASTGSEAALPFLHAVVPAMPKQVTTAQDRHIPPAKKPCLDIINIPGSRIESAASQTILKPRVQDQASATLPIGIDAVTEANLHTCSPSLSSSSKSTKTANQQIIKKVIVLSLQPHHVTNKSKKN